MTLLKFLFYLVFFSVFIINKFFPQPVILLIEL